jgi:hypothetical protein
MAAFMLLWHGTNQFNWPCMSWASSGPVSILSISSAHACQHCKHARSKLEPHGPVCSAGQAGPGRPRAQLPGQHPRQAHSGTATGSWAGRARREGGGAKGGPRAGLNQRYGLHLYLRGAHCVPLDLEILAHAFLLTGAASPRFFSGPQRIRHPGKPAARRRGFMA